KQLKQHDQSPPPGSLAADWRIVRELAGHVWPPRDPQRPRRHTAIRVRVAVAVALLVSGKLLNVGVPVFFKYIVDALNVSVSAGTSATASAAAAAAAVASPVPLSVVATLVGGVVVGYGAARFGAVLFQELRNAVFGAVAQGAMRDAARDVFARLVALDMRFHLERQTGGLVRAIDRGTKGIQAVLNSVVFNVVPTALEIALACALIGYQFGAEYVAITVATVIAYSGFTVATTAWRTKFRIQMNSADNQAATTATDTLLNIEAVKLFNNERFELARYDKALARYQAAALKTTTSLAFLNAGQNLIISAALTAVMFLASKAVLDGAVSLGDLVLINGLLFQLSVPLNFLGMAYRETRQGLLDLDALYRLRKLADGEAAAISGTPSVTLAQQQLNAPSLPSSGPQPLLIGAEGAELRLEDVWFSYAAGAASAGTPPPPTPQQHSSPAGTSPSIATPAHPHHHLLRGVSLTIPAGTTAALVGPSGCGKSTVLRLLLRLADPTRGNVLVAGRDLRSLDPAALRAAVGVVPQDAVLFNNSVEYNVRYGRVSATDADVRAAAERALLIAPKESAAGDAPGDDAPHTHRARRHGAAGNVAASTAAPAAALADGLDTRVGERGLKISGGEKQRVLLARMFLKDPPICLFDEATSALDQATESTIQSRIFEFLATPPASEATASPPPRRRTAVFVAHRLATVARCDQIIVLREGRVEEAGAHDELLAKGGLYARMWSAQQQQKQEQLQVKQQAGERDAAATVETTAA
ncbi:Iron-sulfur clusters transporter atm1, mitochondrial, partial [Cladochytrium tenue]